MRTDLRAWIAKKKRASSRPSMSYKHATRMSLYRLHRGDSVAQAIRYMHRFMDSHSLANSARRIEGERDIMNYSEWMERDSVVSIDTKSRLQFEVAPNIFLGGEVPRIDILSTGSGYRAILVGEEDVAWRSQLRMPLIQQAVARKLKRPERLISVGVQKLDGSDLLITHFRPQQVSAAVEELAELAQIAVRALSS